MAKNIEITTNHKIKGKGIRGRFMFERLLTNPNGTPKKSKKAFERYDKSNKLLTEEFVRVSYKKGLNPKNLNKLFKK